MDLKDHPLMITVGTFTGTLLFAYNLILPIFTKAQDNKIEVLEGQVATLTTRAEQAEKTAQSAQQYAYQLTAETMLTPNNAYPVGLREIRICDPVEKVRTLYGSKAVDHQYFYQTELTDNATFSTAAFTYEKKTQLVDGILLFYRKPNGKAATNESKHTSQQDSVLEALKDAFPQSTITKPTDPDELKYTLSTDSKLKISVSPTFYQIELSGILAKCT